MYKVIVKLKGGLGNQMFEYAAARAIAERNQMELVLDTRTGFIRDKVYRRSYCLDRFALMGRGVRTLETFPFWIEGVIRRLVESGKAELRTNPWGLLAKDDGRTFYSRLVNQRFRCNLWLDGYWQSERYFQDITADIESTFDLEAPNEERFISLAQRIQSEDAVAIGVRLYEESPPGASRVTPFSFYEQAAQRIAVQLNSPVFYVFCTSRKLIDGKLNFPGEVCFVTGDEGYADEYSTLWLLSRFRYFIISNSSFYWWGAWLAERKWPEVEVYASNLFGIPESYPERWITI